MLFGNALFFPQKIVAQINGFGSLTVDRTSIESGQMVSGKATVILFDSFAGNFNIGFGDGSDTLSFNCPVNPGSFGEITTCDQNFVHTYYTPRIYTISLNSFGISGFGGGPTVNLTSEDIIVVPRPTSTVATSIEPALIATSTAEIIQSIIRVIYWIIGSLLVLLIIMGGYYILTSAGNPEKITKGRKIIIYAALGFAIMAISKGALQLVYLIIGINIP